MKHYSFKTGPNKYFDTREWRKHILGLESKVDSLWNYLNLTNPNYSIINWNQDNLETDDKHIQITNDPAIGAIYKKPGSNNEYYFLKCFNNKDLIWGRPNIYFINDYPSNELIEGINSNEIRESLLIQAPENSWLLIDSNIEKGYQFLPSSSGYGGIYTIQWCYNATENKYYLNYTLLNNGKDVEVVFFNKPTQTRWNTYVTSNNVNLKYFITSFKDVKNTLTKEYYQGQKQLMKKFFISKDKNENSIKTTIYEEVGADYVVEEDSLQEWEKTQFKINNTIGLGVYYW